VDAVVDRGPAGVDRHRSGIARLERPERTGPGVVQANRAHAQDPSRVGCEAARCEASRAGWTPFSPRNAGSAVDRTGPAGRVPGVVWAAVTCPPSRARRAGLPFAPG